MSKAPGRACCGSLGLARGLPHLAIRSGAIRGLCTLPQSTPRAQAGIFVDAENLQGALKRDGARRLVELASEFGNPIVRRAYGNWNVQGLQLLQHSLVSNGFQLIHVPYPVSKKSAADIAMVVDVMATQYRMPELSCFVLATGDSDFSHLFCHLRQDGRRVVGFGPRSALSEIVKTSVDRYIYTNEHGPGGYEPMKAALCPPLRLPPLPRSLPRPRSCRRPRCFDADARPWKVAVALVERALLQLDEAAPDEMVNASRLKERLIALDSAFDEKRFGPFSSLRAFLESPEFEPLISHDISKQGMRVGLKPAARRAALAAATAELGTPEGGATTIEVSRPGAGPAGEQPRAHPAAHAFEPRDGPGGGVGCNGRRAARAERGGQGGAS